MLPLFFVSLNKEANGAWKWWQHSHAYRQTLSLLLHYVSESAHLEGESHFSLNIHIFCYCKGLIGNIFTYLTFISPCRDYNRCSVCVIDDIKTRCIRFKGLSSGGIESV